MALRVKPEHWGQEVKVVSPDALCANCGYEESVHVKGSYSPMPGIFISTGCRTFIPKPSHPEEGRYDAYLVKQIGKRLENGTLPEGQDDDLEHTYFELLRDGLREETNPGARSPEAVRGLRETGEGPPD